mmetsp:Transcript_19267/g.68488  ORF Transcript_19267/g.68488 Transcript_19267/m.68488 type:complete len:88 (-) Transcript_19267:136-399(-)
MFALRRCAPAVARVAARAPRCAPRFSGGGPTPLAHDHVKVPDDNYDIVIPELVETLEWVLATPPPLHQFEEPPIIVEIADLEPAGSR